MRLGYCGSIVDAAQVRAAGFDFLEVNVQQVLQGTLDDAAWHATVPDPAKLVLPIEAANCLMPGDMPVIGPGRDLDALRRYMKNVAGRASRLGIGTLVFASGRARRRPDKLTTKVAHDHLVEFLQIAGDVCEGQRITLVVEHLNRNETNTINKLAQAVELCDRVASPAVQVVVDTYHLGLEREDDQAVIDVGDRLRHVHIAEPVGRIQPGGHGPTSPDSFDFAGFFALLSKIGYDGRVSFEGKLTGTIEEVGPSLISYVRDAWHLAREGVAG